MQQFQLPQFIDVEDKLFGPFTIKQFVYVAGGGGLIYLYLELLPKSIAFVLALPTAALALSLAFRKVNGQPFIKIIQAFINHSFSTKMLLWQKNYSKTQIPTQVEEIQPEKKEAPRKTTSSLQSLSWSLDVFDTRENKTTK